MKSRSGRAFTDDANGHLWRSRERHVIGSPAFDAFALAPARLRA